MKTAVWIVSAAFAVVAVVVAPPAQAHSMLGNYELLTDRWTNNSWVWTMMHSCGPGCGSFITPNQTGNLDIQAIPRPLESRPFEAEAVRADGRYTMVVDVPDGVRCPGYNLPSHDVYSWDATTLDGSVDVSFDQGCFNAPAGAMTYSFALRRM